MRFVECGQCCNAYQIGGDMEEVDHLLKDRSDFPCITQGCLGRMQRVRPTDVQAETVREIPLNSFFRAIHGFGLSNGDPSSAKRFKELLTTKRVVGMQIVPIGQPERVIVKSLVLEDGTRLHFESSGRGACCYFIEEPTPSCVETFDAEHSVDTEDAAASSSADRKEAGRVAKRQIPARELGSESVIHVRSITAVERPDTEPVPVVSATGELPEKSATGLGSSGPAVRVRTDSNPTTS